MRYLKKFNESEVNQEKVNWDIEEEARLYLAYLIDSFQLRQLVLNIMMTVMC
jgi:hypothetical protein